MDICYTGLWFVSLADTDVTMMQQFSSFSSCPNPQHTTAKLRRPNNRYQQ